MTFIGYECKTCYGTTVKPSNCCKFPYVCDTCGLVKARNIKLIYE